MSYLIDQDPVIFNEIKSEQEREKEIIRLIPSENYASKAVMEATGSIFTNKYSEGYPGKRYYEGQECIDKIETLACQRACQLFHMDHANVQPYSGSPANMAAFFALLEPKDKILGLNLSEGGHLTHGFKMNFSAKFFEAQNYSVNEKTHQIDYDQILDQALKFKPKMLIAGYTAYPRSIDFSKFREIADRVGAYLLCDISHINALCISGDHMHPAPYADIITSTTHKALRGPRGGLILCKKEHAQKIDKAIMPGLQGGPHNHATAAKAVAFKEALSTEFQVYAHQIYLNAKALAKALKEKGFNLVSDGTDTHLILIDAIKSFNIAGKPYAQALYKAGIETNYNTVPFDVNPPFNPSGVRIGTPAITTIGMKEDHMEFIAEKMYKVAKKIDDAAFLEKTRLEIKEYMKQFDFSNFI